MRQRIIVLLTILSFLSCNAFSQDVWLQSHFSPNSGCGLTNSELVNVLINNNSGAVMPSNTINVSYTIDGGSLTQQLLNSNLFPGASWNFNFSVNANLSSCGSHVVKVWVTRTGDANHLNDTLQWTVQNDCPVIPGTIASDTTVCSVGNAGTLTLNGWSNGNIIGWEYSINGGTTWVGTGQTSTTYTYSGVTQPTIYHVVFDGGSCTKDTSGTATILVQAPGIPGTLTGSDSLCVTVASGVVSMSGASGPVLHWEWSSNNGSSWSNIMNTTSTLNYTGLPATIWYRTQTDGGACPDVYSDTAIIYVEQLTDPGAMTGSDSLCALSATGSVAVTGNIGPVSYWQTSTDSGFSWSTVTNQTTAQSYINLPVTTWYRVYTDGGFCPSYYSDTAIVFVQPAPVQPTITGSDSLCASHADGVLNLTGPSNNVIMWQSSIDNGATWTPIANSTTTLIYIGLTMNTWYRAVVDGGLCPDIFSDTAIIVVDQVTSAGTITGSDSLCILNASGALNLTGTIGAVSYWEFSTDNGATWNTIANTTSTENYTGLTQTTWYRAYTDGGACPSYFSDTAIVYVEPLLIPGTVQGSDTVCGTALAGTLTLSGASGTVSQWESSTDFGTTWTPIANTTTAYSYSAITTTTIFRVLTHGTFCADVYSDTAIIDVEMLSDAGTLNASQQLCMGDSFQLDLTGYAANAFQWIISADSVVWTPIVGATSYDYTVVNDSTAAYYYVIAQNVNCPPDTSNVVSVTVVPNPIADAGTDVTITLGDTTLLTGTGGLVGVWTPGLTLSDSVIASPFAIPLVTTTYTYTVLDGNGCMGEDSVTVTVKLPTQFDIKNVITSNGDGYNDAWIIQGIEYYPSTFVIVFNIYGKEVYSSDDYQNDWKGTWKDRKLPNGTYYYTVVPGGTESKLKGTLTILGDE